MMKWGFNVALLAAFGLTFLRWGILAATVVMMVGVTVEMLATLALGERPSRWQWVGLLLTIGLGGVTLLFQDPIFFKLRPSAFYWLCAGVLLASHLGWGANVMHGALGKWISVPAATWSRLQTITIAHLVTLGVINIVVAYGFSTAVWVVYRLVGPACLTATFASVLSIWLRRHRQSGEAGA
ncbi:septation protein IspZ [Nocardia sp. NPDC052001]|uniref:inner membrane-spanning protein YciB n=1 Tax=Nocardia sp. NPDC052001 TaxID=3154853 RepID=UPI00343AF1F3